jgi:hypothetical protein
MRMFEQAQDLYKWILDSMVFCAGERSMIGNDIQLRHEAAAELDWDPGFDSRDIGVIVNPGGGEG